MHRLVAGAAMALTLAAQVASAEPFTFVAIGDMPYKLPDDYSRFERLIGAINQIQPAFTVHVGDFKGVRTRAPTRTSRRSRATSRPSSSR